MNFNDYQAMGSVNLGSKLRLRRDTYKVSMLTTIQKDPKVWPDMPLAQVNSGRLTGTENAAIV